MFTRVSKKLKVQKACQLWSKESGSYLTSFVLRSYVLFAIVFGLKLSIHCAILAGVAGCGFRRTYFGVHFVVGLF